jgi:hypothetical protein
LARCKNLSICISEAEQVNQLAACGLPLTLFVSHFVSQKRHGSLDILIATTTAEHFGRIKALGNWAFEQGIRRREKLLKLYESGSVFGRTIKQDREAVITALQCWNAKLEPRDGNMGKAVAQRHVLREWMVTQGARGLASFDTRAAAFEVKPGFPFKARCGACQGTLHYGMPSEAWMAEECIPEVLAWYRQPAGQPGRLPGSAAAQEGFEKPPTSVLVEISTGRHPLSCAEVPGRILCNEAHRRFL